MCYNSLMVKKELNRQEQSSNMNHPMPGALRVLLSIVFMIPMAVLFAWVLELRCRINNVDETWEWANNSYLLFWYGCVIIYLIMCVIVSVTWRLFFGTGLTFSLICIVSFIHAEKYKLRSIPLLPEDFRMIDATGEIASFVDVWAIVRLVVGVAFVLAGSALLEYCVRKKFGRNDMSAPFWQRHSLIPRATFAMLSVVALAIATRFAIHYDNANARIDWLDTNFTAWDQTINYDDNGFLIAFLYNIGKLDLPIPEGYSKDTIAELKQKYTDISSADTNREDLADIADNIIVVLDETFYDLELFDKYYSHTGKDLLPNLHALFKQYPSGYMYSPEYGGNTANIEFEVLTGLSNYWSQTTPYTSVLSKISNYPSFVETMNRDGYETTAIHAFDGNVYKRNLVYRNIGYETFIDENDMKYQDLENGYGYLMDRNLYREALDIIQENDTNQFIGLVTMQNHLPYNSAWYEDFSFQIINHTDDYSLRCNFQSLHTADQYLGEFIQSLDKISEKTVVLWFGDHAAGLLNEYVNSDLKTERDLAHLTPYFIYANFDIESMYSPTEVARINKQLGFDLPTAGIDLPITTPNCLMNTMYNVLGARKPPLAYMLDTICETEPILTPIFLQDKELKEIQALKDYELVNYDLLNGEKYWIKFSD